MLTVEDTDHITNIPTHVLLEITRNLTLGDALILRSSSKQINNRVSLLSPQITQIHKYYETYKPSWRNTLKHMKSSWHFGISAKLSMAFGLIGLLLISPIIAFSVPFWVIFCRIFGFEFFLPAHLWVLSIAGSGTLGLTRTNYDIAESSAKLNVTLLFTGLSFLNSFAAVILAVLQALSIFGLRNFWNCMQVAFYHLWPVGYVYTVVNVPQMDPDLLTSSLRECGKRNKFDVSKLNVNAGLMVL